MKRLLSLILCVVCLAVTGTSTQAPFLVFVDENIDANDLVGRRETYSVKEIIDRSTRYCVTTTSNRADLTLSLVSFAQPGCGYSTFSVAFTNTANGRLLAHSVMGVPPDDVDGMARSLWADMDRYIPR